MNKDLIIRVLIFLLNSEHASLYHKLKNLDEGDERKEAIQKVRDYAGRLLDELYKEGDKP